MKILKSHLFYSINGISNKRIHENIIFKINVYYTQKSTRLGT